MQKGFWNGQLTAEFSGITYEVAHVEETPCQWQNSMIGQRRQALRITQDGESWIIDNEHGDGYYKLTVGMGSPSCGHKSVSHPTKVEEIPDHEIHVKYDWQAIKMERLTHDAWMKKYHAREFERLEALRSIIDGRPATIQPKG